MNTISFYLAGIRGLYKQRKSFKSKPLDFIAEELIRNVHSIEKGLCISNPRLGFGHKKQEEMLKQMQLLKGSDVELHCYALKMAADAICEYIEFHDSCGYTDEFIEKMRDDLKSFSITKDGKYGGTSLFNTSDLESFDKEMIERFFCTRHSIRDFSDSDINDELLSKALILAERAPSACNRQGVRAYVIGGDTLDSLASKLSDVGGFIEKAKRLIVITGKVNAYRTNEINQYIVSSSIYAAYLSLTIHLYGMGSCIIQRPVIWTKSWDALRKQMNIDRDEQIVCMLAVGALKESCKVPVSYRLGESIYTFKK